MTNLPETVVECGGCDEELNVLVPHLYVMVKAQRMVLLANTGDPFNVPENDDGPVVNLGTQSGRGRIVRFHNFACISKYANHPDRKGAAARIEPHEEDEIYVPADNRSPEELVEAGEMSPNVLAALNAAQEDGEQ